MRRPALVAGLVLLAAGSLWAQPPDGPAPVEVDPQVVVGPPQGAPLSGKALDMRTEEVGALLRCPVCQGLSVTDSPSSMAVKMKAQVKEMLAAGYEQTQILAYFEHSYGEFVRLEPPLRGVNWLVWLAPLLALVGGAAVVTWVLRRMRPAAKAEAPEESLQGAQDLPAPDTLPDDPTLASYVLKVRELAYGWPSGVRPRPAGNANSGGPRAAD